MITRIYQLLTGKPWTTSRSAAAEFGPPPAARYATALAGYTDLDLIRHGDQILAGLRQRAAIAQDLTDRYTRHGEDLPEAVLDCGCPAGRVAYGHGHGHEIDCDRKPTVPTIRGRVTVP